MLPYHAFNEVHGMFKLLHGAIKLGFALQEIRKSAEKF
jgi:hypothetical protein